MQLTEKNGLVINIDNKTKYYNESELKNMICFFENNQIPNGEVYILKDSYKEPQHPVTTLTKEEYTGENCNDSEDSIVSSVISQFKERSRVGKLKYNTTLDRKDLSKKEWIEHAKQEAMDFVLYLEKLKNEI